MVPFAYSMCNFSSPVMLGISYEINALPVRFHCSQRQDMRNRLKLSSKSGFKCFGEPARKNVEHGVDSLSVKVPFMNVISDDGKMDTSYLDVRAYNRVIDFYPSSLHSENQFHIIYDVVLAMFDLIRVAEVFNTAHTVVVAPFVSKYLNTRFQEYLEFFIPQRNFSLVSHTRRAQYMPTYPTLIVNNEATVYSISEGNLWLDYFCFYPLNDLPQYHMWHTVMLNVTSAFTKAVQSRLDIISEERQIDSSNITLLILCRKDSRNVGNIYTVGKQLVNTLFNDAPIEVETYNGTDSVKHTIEKFARANIVLAMHGAGLGNAIFCRNDTLVLELTFAHTENAANLEQDKREAWRTNRVIGDLHQGLHWITYLMQPSREDIIYNIKSNDMHFKGLSRTFEIPPADVALLIEGVLNHTLAKTNSTLGSWKTMGPAENSTLEFVKLRTMSRYKNLKSKFLTNFHRQDSHRRRPRASAMTNFRAQNSAALQRKNVGVDTRALAYAQRKRARKLAKRKANS